MVYASLTLRSLWERLPRLGHHRSGQLTESNARGETLWVEATFAFFCSCTQTQTNSCLSVPVVLVLAHPPVRAPRPVDADERRQELLRCRAQL
jgi:hypothetical protein